MPSWWNKITGKTRRNEARRVAEQAAYNAAAEQRGFQILDRAKERAKRRNTIRQIHQLREQYKKALEEVNAATKKREENYKPISSRKKEIEEEIAVLDSEIQRIAEEYHTKDALLKQKKQELATQNTSFIQASKANTEKLERLKNAIIDKEVQLTSGTNNYGYITASIAKAAFGPPVRTGIQEWNYGPPPAYNVAFNRASSKLKTPENVLRIVNKYTNNTNVTGGKRRKTLKRK